MMTVRQTPYERGYRAGRNGASPLSCPYISIENREEWLRGWDDGDRARKDAGE